MLAARRRSALLDIVTSPPHLKQPAFFLGHGAAALTMGDGDATGRWLERLGPSLRTGAPRAVLCVSAHYVAKRLCVTGAERPKTLRHDGHAALRSFTYPAPGSPEVARRALELLLHAGLDATFDAERGLDHGAWVPLSKMFPEHDVPVVELTLHAGGDPEHHLAIGRAIEPLRHEGVLIVGSGGVTHDAEIEEDAGDGNALSESSRRFEAWVTELVTRAGPYARSRGLARFQNHELAAKALPSGEHFLPLLVVAGAASVDKSSENVGEQVHAGAQRGRSMAAFRFAR